MTLAQITALIAANIDTTGRRLTTGVKMRQVLDGIVAYLTGIPDFAFTGVVREGGLIKGSLGPTITVPTGGVLTFEIQLIFNRGKKWDEIQITGDSSPMFTTSFISPTLPTGETVALAVLFFDSYLEGTYTYDITAGGITKTLTIEVEGL
jgi:hypothetical protein